MTTTHIINFSQAQKMTGLENDSVDLIVTSPPYPMITMWDSIMALQNQEIGIALEANEGSKAFELMHKELDQVWYECNRVLKNGGFLCINIGDATRTINGKFELFNNHARIVNACTNFGFTNLPNIIWRKQTNAPNKFMGSGMLPGGAYVTLEHEWILIFRKGSKRVYKTEHDKLIRRNSSFFWEERNIWFSDLWELKGIKQKIVNCQSRDRSASFPFAIPYRLINMYSQQGDTILDPFFGLGTTATAAMISERNSIGFEIDSSLSPLIKSAIDSIKIFEANNFIKERLDTHKTFIKNRSNEGKKVGYTNESMACKVITKQETDMHLNYLKTIKQTATEPLSFECNYDGNVDSSPMPFSII